MPEYASLAISALASGPGLEASLTMHHDYPLSAYEEMGGWTDNFRQSMIEQFIHEAVHQFDGQGFDVEAADFVRPERPPSSRHTYWWIVVSFPEPE